MIPRVLLVTDESVPFARTLSLVGEVDSPDVAVLLRAPSSAMGEYAAYTRALLEVVAPEQIILHGRRSFDLAEEFGALGVHVPSRELDGPLPPYPMRTSAAVHNDAELARAIAWGASAVLLSPIFSVPGKGSPIGIAALSHAREQLREGTVLYALGGVNASNARACIDAGAKGVAVQREYFHSANPGASLKALLEALAGSRN